MRRILLGFGLVFWLDMAQAEGLLFIGNSMTHHVASPSIGWKGDWGMAASSQEGDYVHLTMRKLKAGGRRGVTFELLNVSNFEKEPSAANAAGVVRRIAAPQVDSVIFFIGDNVNPGALPWNNFLSAYEALLASARSKDKKIVCVSLWWAAEMKNKDLKRICETHGGSFALLPPAAQQAEAKAQGHANKSVAAHPGDWGMELIAHEVHSALERSGRR